MARRRKRNKKWISWMIILVLLVAASAVVYLVWDNYFREKESDDYDEQIVIAVVDDEKDEKKVDLRNDDEEKEVIKKEEPKQYEGSDPNQGSEITGAVTYAGIIEPNLVLRINIDQYLSGGICKLSLISDGVVAYEDSANIVGSASTSTCEGFNIPTASLKGGRYQILVSIDANEKTGTIGGEVSV